MTSDGDLKVDYIILEAAERDLGSLKSEFDGIENRRDETRDVWGHDGVKDAMHEFASNMDHNRGKLSEKLATTGEKVGTTLETFRDADSELAKSFDEKAS